MSTIIMTSQDYLAMSDREFEAALFYSLPEELRLRIAQAPKNEDERDYESEKEKLIEQIKHHFSAELVEAACERERRRIAREILAESWSIGELFAEAQLEVPARLAHLQLPFACLSDHDDEQTYHDWPKATLADILYQRKVLTDRRQWGLLDDVEQLCRAVEPVMRRHSPAMTLAEALAEVKPIRANSPSGTVS